MSHATAAPRREAPPAPEAPPVALSEATPSAPSDPQQMHWARSTLLHLRFLNSFHLAPVILFALSQADQLTLGRGLLIVFIMHAFVYPSSAGYNSYFDRDTEATGGLKSPPPVHDALYWTVTAFDVLAVALSAWINPVLGVGVLLWTLASRAYSNDKVRIKARPWLGYLWVVFFQGWFTYEMVWFGAQDLPVSDWPVLFDLKLILPGLFCSLLVAGSYPLTQIYQFEEDAKRGDKTVAMTLGYSGTFLWCAGALTIGFGAMIAYFLMFERIQNLLVVTPLFLPSLVFLGWWFFKVRQDTSHANHHNAMRMSNISAWCGNTAFIVIIAFNHWWLSAGSAS
jgi:4-hydroxybenzoate polyprenyltransferase